MEFLFLLYPAGFVSIVATLFLYLWNQDTAQRAVQVAKSHLTPAEDIEAGYAAVADSVKRLRAAKNEEQVLMITNWEKQFYSPEEYRALQDSRRHEQMLATGVIRANMIPADKIKSVSAVNASLKSAYETVPDGPEWMPLTARKRNEPEELSYSQRRVQRAGAFVRSAPSTSASVYGVAEGGSTIRFDGYVHGESVAGNDIWFVYIGKNSKLPKFVHSIATTNRSTSGMADLTEYDTETVINGAGEICSVIKTSPTGGIAMTAEYLQLPNATIRSRQAENFNPKVYYYNDGTVKYTETPEEDAAWQKHHRGKLERGISDTRLDPDQQRDKERQPAIVKNYQKDQQKQRYNPVPKTHIPSTIRKRPTGR